MTRAVIPVHILIPSSGKVTLKSPITNVGRAVGCVVVAVGLLEGKVVGSVTLEAIVGLDVDVVVEYILGLADGFAVGVDVVIDLLGLAVGVDSMVGFIVVGLDVMGLVVVGVAVVGLADDGIDDKGRFVVG